MISNRTELSDFCQIFQGGRLKLSGSDFVSQGFPAYGAGGLNGYLDVAEFNCEAVILSAIGARCGKCFHVSGQWTTLANTQITIPDPDRADSRFLWHQLNDEKRWPRSGTGQPFIKPSDVMGHKVFLPPLEEQRRIAAILDRAANVRELATQSLASTSRALYESIFSRDILADRHRITRIGDIAIQLPSGYGSDPGRSPFSAPVAKVSNVTAGGRFHRDFESRSFTQSELERLLVSEYDLLVVKSSGSKEISSPAKQLSVAKMRQACLLHQTSSCAYALTNLLQIRVSSGTYSTARSQKTSSKKLPEPQPIPILSGLLMQIIQSLFRT